MHTRDSARAYTVRLEAMLGEERKVLVDFLLALSQFDRERGYLELGYGSLWDYVGPTQWQNQVMHLGSSNSGAPVRAAAGVGLLWDSPLGPIRFDFAFPFLKQSYDRTQWFRFSGGTSF